MTRLEKCEILKSKGYTYDPDTGKIYNRFGKEITGKILDYIVISGGENFGNIRGHHFAYYMVYGNVDFKMLDHINQNKSDNRISNLRISNHTKNAYNSSAKGYTWDKQKNKWRSQITINSKLLFLGFFDNEKDAKNAYIETKKKYHII
jgi:hypothetical protein